MPPRGDEERIRDAGAEGYVSKPISVIRFVEAVRQLLEDAAAREHVSVPEDVSAPETGYEESDQTESLDLPPAEEPEVEESEEEGKDEGG